MPATGQNFEVFAGTDLVLAVTATDNDAVTPLNLSGASLTWRLATAFGVAATLTKTSPSGGISVTDAAAGELAVALGAADTADLAPGDYVHELDVRDASSNVSTLAIGRVKVKPRILP